MGSTVVNSAVFTRIAYPEMTRLGYDSGLAGGVIAASGTLAAFIPPSISFVLYALLTQQSVGQLLLAGVAPGLLTATAYIVGILVIVITLMEIGVITPPVAINLFTVVSASDKDLKLTALYRGVAPFIVIELVVLTILIAFPALSTWLPYAMVR